MLILAIGFLNSCNKEQKLAIEDNEIHVSIEERSQTDLQDLDDAEQKVKEVVGCSGIGISGSNSPTFFEEIFGIRNDLRIIYYSNDGTRTFAFPLLKNQEIVNLLLVSEEGEYYILEETDRLAYEDVADTRISPYIPRIFGVGRYLSTEIQLPNIRMNLRADYEIERNDKTLIVREKTSASGRLSSTATDKLLRGCDSRIMSEMAAQYRAFFGLDISYQSLVYEAVVASQPGGEFCVCPIPDLILEYLGLAGQDWFYDEAYWASNPTFPTQVLPTYTNFYNAFPKNADGSWMYGADEIYDLAGGDVLQVRLDDPNRTQNTCALKVSIALNGAGVIIPNIPTTSTAYGTVAGLNGKYYFLNARSLSNWMKGTFTPTNTYMPSEYINPSGFHSLMNGRKGITISIYGGGGTSGHADIYTGTSCSNSPNNPNEACGIAGTIDFWQLN